MKTRLLYFKLNNSKKKHYLMKLLNKEIKFSYGSILGNYKYKRILDPWVGFFAMGWL